MTNKTSTNKSWDGKSKGNKWGYAMFVFLLRKGGITPAYFLLNFVASYYIWFMPNVTKPLFDLYHHRLKYSKRESRKMIRKNIICFGQSMLDKIVVLSGLKHQFEIEKTGAHFLDEMVIRGKGGILVSAHTGNWELAGHLLERLKSVINIVMYDGEAAEIKAYMEKVTGPKTFNVIYIREDMSHIYEMSAALRRNEFICIHADRYVQGSRSIAANFLGEEALFPLGPFILASKLAAPVCFVFALKKEKHKYHFYGFPPKIYIGRGVIGAQQMLQDYVSILEKKVKEYPEQWFNYYDFWKK